MRLNGWQRLAVVAGVVWLPIGFIWGNSIGIHQGDWVSDALVRCVSNTTDEAGENMCMAHFHAVWPQAIAYHWWYAAAMVFMPIPFLLLAWLCWRVVRWVQVGFAQSNARTPEGK